MFYSTKNNDPSQAKNSLKPLDFQGFLKLKGLTLNVTTAVAVLLVSHPALANTVIGGEEITNLGNDAISTIFLVARLIMAAAMIILAVFCIMKQKPLGFAAGLFIGAFLLSAGPPLLDRFTSQGADGFMVNQHTSSQ